MNPSLIRGAVSDLGDGVIEIVNADDSQRELSDIGHRLERFGLFPSRLLGFTRRLGREVQFSLDVLPYVVPEIHVLLTMLARRPRRRAAAPQAATPAPTSNSVAGSGIGVSAGSNSYRTF